MIFEVGQHLRCFLRTLTVVEGIVQESTEQQLVLKSLDGESLLIIHQPAQDIVLTKIRLAPVSETQRIADKIRQKSLESQEKGEVLSEEDLHHMTIAELQMEKAAQERRIIANKLQEHHIEGPRKVTYEQPRFFKKPSAQ
jgi:hypothetical protein